MKRWYIDALLRKGIQKRVALQIVTNLLNTNKFKEVKLFTTNIKVLKNMKID